MNKKVLSILLDSILVVFFLALLLLTIVALSEALGL